MIYFRKNRYEREIYSLKVMIKFYCNRKHNIAGLCDSCSKVQDYALQRYHHCPYGNAKPVCSVCPVHCYRPDMRAEIKKIMRFAGPRMLWNYPLIAFDHMFLKKKHFRSYFSTLNIYI